jgi:uncharacterized protein with FMN-binding domain
MKRYPIVIGTTLAGLAGILSFHTRGSHALSSSAVVTPGTSTPASPKSAPPTTQGTAANGGPPANASATGASEQYGYGVLSVKVTVSGSHITDVSIVNVQTDASYSQYIAQQSIPYLRQQVLSAQSAHIDGVSGATYTSEAYALSVQSALDQLHFH